MGPRAALFLIAAALLAACGSPESRLRKKLATTHAGTIQLPSGRIDVSSETAACRRRARS